MNWNDITHTMQPVITYAVEALIGALALYVLQAVGRVLPKVKAAYEARTTASQREALHKIALEAFAFAETTWKDTGGPSKLSAAMGYVSKRLREVGIAITPEEIEAAVHHAWLTFNPDKKDPK
ncbi:phage holin, LLH family [Paenibacillus sp. BK720]|uniref:phage holin, LLH family n=1 Tax=Paenibacillus sp. BK720 TaxID=2587092 RepID=UPI00141E81CB|nr:phage holin, LLH family [Paenibacillus sp. BK720]NIK67948.1 hypothetical protein [Paenibacillus sp. BK720]